MRRSFRRAVGGPQLSSPPADTDRPHPPGDSVGEEGEGAEGDGGEDEEIKNPRIKELSEEAARHRLNAKAEKERADTEAELAALNAAGDEETVRALRIELAWVKANLARPEPFRDVEAAMKMVDLGAVQVDDTGAVTGLDEAMAYVAKKYPYMVNDAATTRPTYDTPDTPSGRPDNGRKEGDRETLSRANLEKKFPALRRAR
jgi:hypothetical protein